MNTDPAPRFPPRVSRPEPVPVVESPIIEALLDELNLANDRAEVLAAFRAAHAQTPIVEAADTDGERIVTFIFDDPEAVEILLFVNRLTTASDISPSLMHRVEGTSIWYLAYQMGVDWRASYNFIIRKADEPRPWESEDGSPRQLKRAMEQGKRDPLNPHTVYSRSETLMSVVELEKAPPQKWADPRVPLSPAGTVTEMITPDGQKLWVYLSAGVDEGGEAPLLVVFDGDIWVGPRGGQERAQDLPTTIDNLVADREIPPCAAIFIDSGTDEDRRASLDPKGLQNSWIVTHLMPWARQLFPITDNASEVVAVGQSLGGYAALQGAFRYPDSIGCAIAQSPSLWQGGLPDIPAGDRAPRVYLEVGAQEWVLRDPCRKLAQKLRTADADSHYFEYNGGHDYACWRGGIADGLRSLLSGKLNSRNVSA